MPPRIPRITKAYLAGRLQSLGHHAAFDQAENPLYDECQEGGGDGSLEDDAELLRYVDQFKHGIGSQVSAWSFSRTIFRKTL